MSDLFAKLGIDWKLLIANTITFFIVLWLLRKFAYRPLLGVMDKRRQTIDAGLKQAEQAKAELAAIAAGKQQVLAEAKTEALKIIHQAKAEAEVVRINVINQAQTEASAVAAKTQQLLERQKGEMVRQAKTELADLVVEAAAKVIGEQLDADRQYELAEKTVAQLTKTA